MDLEGITPEKLRTAIEVLAQLAELAESYRLRRSPLIDTAARSCTNICQSPSCTSWNTRGIWPAG